MIKDLVPQVIMRRKSVKESKLSFNKLEASSIKNTILNIAGYKDHIHLATLPHVYFQLLSIFGLIKETIGAPVNLINTGKNDKQPLIAYISQYIHQPERCKIKNIAEEFNIPVSYFGDYLKGVLGSVTDYLNLYRANLIAKSIESGRLNMKQIAVEFGFSDESHFSNYFKKQFKLRPAAFKSQGLTNQAKDI